MTTTANTTERTSKYGTFEIPYLNSVLLVEVAEKAQQEYEAAKIAVTTLELQKLTAATIIAERETEIELEAFKKTYASKAEQDRVVKGVKLDDGTLVGAARMENIAKQELISANERLSIWRTRRDLLQAYIGNRELAAEKFGR